ncbi:adenylate/guanylate cyclase domain-containing protein [Parasulfuritortus cantonensis]|uniref:Adenylate/guanylate cyclase domain-containing protein n=2 Tax=Parasulfuritortus cantonensis TaxID=2528202 RepID=A0A4R1BDB3_9PROT|nr:adenylate/guanylate cyclase domain-containing protein [Parasulfuritortus cantonensis]
MNLRGRRFVQQFAASLVFLALLLGHVAGVYHLGILDKLDAALYDYKLNLGMIRAVDERVVIVDIDEKSLQEVGRWPWPRDKMARLTENLFQQYGVASVGYDIVFAEPDQSSGLPVLEHLAKGRLAGDAGFAGLLEQLRPGLDYDAKLGQAVAGWPSVLGYYFNFAQGAETTNPDGLPAPLLDCAGLHKVGIRPEVGQAYSANLPSLQAKAATAGFFNMEADFDGVARRMPLVIEHQGKCYGSLALLTTQQAMGAGTPTVRPAAGARPPALDLDGLVIPLDAEARAMVPYRPPGAFEYVSAARVLDGSAEAAKLEGRAVLIGSSAPGIMDLRVTPTAQVFPGVEIHANMISGILDGAVKWEPLSATRIQVLTVLLAGLAMAVLLPFAAPIWALLATLLVGAGLLAGDYYLWRAWNMHLAAASPLVTVLGLFVINMSYGFFVEARSKAQITRLFGQYVPPELVDEMAKDPERYSLRGESRVMTVLFSDIVGFTSISEKLEASQLADMLNAYLSHMTKLVQESRGTIDKYIGDAIMAFWGAPMSDERHARDAVLTAMAMQATLAELNPQLEAHGWPPVRIGVGVNTGRMSVGNMGSQFRMAYTVMADAVNLASRLEGLTRQYGSLVLIGEDTKAACPDLAFMTVDRVRVKGKQVPVTIYEPLGIASEVAKERLDEAAEFEAALADYLARRWDAAEAKLQVLNGRRPTKLYDVYLGRIAHFRAEPPPDDWDGAFTFTTK